MLGELEVGEEPAEVTSRLPGLRAARSPCAGTPLPVSPYVIVKVLPAASVSAGQ
jgi:hypothetical protein